MKEAFTSFGPASMSSVLEATYPELFARARDDETAVIYWPNFREFGIPVLDGGGSAIAIAYCPWSGRPLPESLRNAYFDELERAGIDHTKQSPPAEFQTELWWTSRGL